MENNNTVASQPTQPQPQAPVVTVPTPPAPESNKMVIWFIVGLLVVAALVGGIYMFLSKQQSAPQQPPAQTMVRATPKPEETVDALDRDLEAVNAASVDSDFSTIDQDLQQL